MGESGTKKLMLALKENFREAGVSPKDMAMLEYAEKITLNPSSITEKDVDNLRAQGWTDHEILEIACLASYRNYIARVANALGVESEERHFADDPATLTALASGLK
ncbi:MAG: carboxymuconolactone decarboxylase family protein [Nitrospinota bacterium]